MQFAFVVTILIGAPSGEEGWVLSTLAEVDAGILVRKHDDDDKTARQMEGWDV